jgi:hypothetical protein
MNDVGVGVKAGLLADGRTAQDQLVKIRLARL